MHKFLFIAIIFSSLALANERSAALYKSLSPKSISKHLAFYELYPDTKEGKDALKNAFILLQGEMKAENDLNLPKIDISFISQIINKTPLQKLDISEKDLELIEKLSSHLKNRSKKTYALWSEEDFLNAAPCDIDLARALFITQLGTSEESRKKIRYYEASLDLISLQILANLPKNPTNREKIKAINDFIFFEMGFRYPPLSNYAKEIDSYTFLPSVIDKRKGICLGTSILYLCIADRLDLPLEAITPPGHIFVRYKENSEIINIETTARGIDVASEDYLGIELKALQVRNNKEVIGLAFINEASLHLKEKNFEKAVSLYEKARKYLPEDFLLKQLLGCCCLFTKKEKKGIKLLKEIENYTSPYFVSKDNLASDFLSKKIDIEGLKAIFTPHEDNRESLLAKKEELEKILKKYPHFRMGLMQLSGIWMQLNRSKEANNVLLEYYKKDPSDPTVNYYLSVISYERYDFKNAWKYLKETEKALKPSNYYPKVLKDFRSSLMKSCLE